VLHLNYICWLGDEVRRLARNYVELSLLMAPGAWGKKVHALREICGPA